MKAKSKKTGKIFTGKLANVAIKAGFADPIEEDTEPAKVKVSATKKPVRKTAKKKPVKKQVMKVKK